jgi:predicted transcriptional regulator
MARPIQDVTEAELAVLTALWDTAAATIRQLTERLYPAGGASSYATVQKLLERLEAKHFVKRHSSVVPHQFAASLSREQLIGRRLRSVADQLCEGSLAPLLSHLVQSQPLRKSEIQQLRGLIDQLDAGGKPKREGR